MGKLQLRGTAGEVLLLSSPSPPELPATLWDRAGAAESGFCLLSFTFPSSAPCHALGQG